VCFCLDKCLDSTFDTLVYARAQVVSPHFCLKKRRGSAVLSYPETATFREFADIARFKPGYITKLKADGRLVLTEDGKRVRVAESLQRIQDTKDPSKIGVALRHAAARAGQSPEGAPLAGDADAPAEADDMAKPTPGYQHWRERSERAKALQAERENEIADGKLLVAVDVAHAVSAGVITLRTRLESLPDMLAPQLVTINDEAKARALLAGEIEHALHELERQFSAIAKEAA
jgi:hypothetical protein